MRTDGGGRGVLSGAVVLSLSLALVVAGCGDRPLPIGDPSMGGAPGGLGGSFHGGSGGQGTAGAGGYGGSGVGGRGYAGSGVGGSGIGGRGVGGRGSAGSGVGGSGIGGAIVTGCDSDCQAGEMCAGGICYGGTSRWITLGGDVHHSGFNVNETGTPPLTPAWSVQLTGAVLWPAVSDGAMVYVSEQSYFGPTTRAWAVSAADGHTIWSHDFGNIFGVGQVSCDGSHVYVAQCNNGGSSFMYSFTAATGQLFWSTPIGAQFAYYWAPLVTPTGRIYFNGGTYGGLYGLITSNGAQTFLNSSLEQFDEWSPLLLNGVVYTFVQGNLRAHDATTGGILSTVRVTWNFVTYSMDTSPISDGDKIYLIAPPNLHAIRVGQSSPVWTAGASFSGMPAVAAGVVYAISGGQLRATDAATGAPLWTFAGDSGLFYPPVVAGDYVYVASHKTIYAVKKATQAVAWTGAGAGWLSIAGGHLYVAQLSGALTAYALSH